MFCKSKKVSTFVQLCSKLSHFMKIRREYLEKRSKHKHVRVKWEKLSIERISFWLIFEILKNFNVKAHVMSLRNSGIFLSFGSSKNSGALQGKGVLKNPWNSIKILAVIHAWPQFLNNFYGKSLKPKIPPNNRSKESSLIPYYYMLIKRASN